MSELDSAQLRRELLTQQAIEAQQDALVKRATQTAALLEPMKDMEESQLRNLLNVAIESRSVEVVINFIRYQIGRNTTKRSWGTSRADFGHQVIGDIRDYLEPLTADVLKRLAEKSITCSLDERNAIVVRLMQLYLGYLGRAFYYAKKAKDFAALREVSNAN